MDDPNEPTQPTRHPAKFSRVVLEELHDILDEHQIEGLIVDPFAGVGRIHELDDWPRRKTVGIELEEEWAGQHEQTIQGDSRELARILSGYGIGPNYPTGTTNQPVDAIVTSPAYGNRMADRYAGDPKGSIRHTYRVYLGRELSEGNGAAMQWGPEYRALHRNVWGPCWWVLREGGWMIVNVSDHVRKGKRVPVVAWHHGVLRKLGFETVEVRTVQTPRQRMGANGNKRVDGEKILVMRKPVHEVHEVREVHGVCEP